jgi:hypothetical protein
MLLSALEKDLSGGFLGLETLKACKEHILQLLPQSDSSCPKR